MSENQGLFSDDNMSTDSDNQNMPEIDYQTELQSRHYYYASFVPADYLSTVKPNPHIPPF
jgi:hypothetical protein